MPPRDKQFAIGDLVIISYGSQQPYWLGRVVGLGPGTEAFTVKSIGSPVPVASLPRRSQMNLHYSWLRHPTVEDLMIHREALAAEEEDNVL